MPIGVIVNTLATAVGGIVGSLIGGKVKQDFKENLNLIFGLCAMGMGISCIVMMEYMPAVVFSIIIGSALGMICHVGDLITRGAEKMQQMVAKVFSNQSTTLSQEEFSNQLVTIIVIFCASGTGIYGSIISGMTGDHNILLAKSILDLFTALIFACNLGLVVSFVAIPQGLLFLLLFIFAGVIYPLCSPAMIGDFKACGGLIMLATGFRMVKLKNFPIADMLPAMVIVMPFSWFWVNCVLPMIG